MLSILDKVIYHLTGETIATETTTESDIGDIW